MLVRTALRLLGENRAARRGAPEIADASTASATRSTRAWRWRSTARPSRTPTWLNSSPGGWPLV